MLSKTHMEIANRRGEGWVLSVGPDGGGGVLLKTLANSAIPSTTPRATHQDRFWWFQRFGCHGMSRAPDRCRVATAT